MSELRAETSDHGIVEPCHALVFRGMAADAQTEKLYPILSQLLGVAADRLPALLAKPPMRLTTHTDQQRLRKHQLSLANLGCITSLSAVWRYHDWIISDGVKQRFDHEHSNQERAVCMLRFTPAPGSAALDKLNALTSAEAEALSHSDLLLDAPLSNDVDLGSEIKNLLRLAKRHGVEGEAQTALALWPGDAELPGDLLDCLDERLKRPGHQSASEFDFGAACKLAGPIWRTLPPLSAIGEQVKDPALRIIWPDNELLNQANTAQPLEKALNSWNAKQAQREQALSRLKLHCERIDRIPSLPSTVMKIHQLAQSSEDNGRDIANLVNQDPSLSARILALVNSSWFGLRARVDSIEHALVVIGREELANMALMMSSEKVFRGLRGETAQALWKHSSHVAELARELARRANRPNPSNLFTAGLLHDVGRILLLSFEPDRMLELQKSAEQYGLPLYELEREVWGYDHAAIGAVMMASWGLPNTLCEIVAQHHGQLDGEKPANQDAVIVALADAIAHRIDGSNTSGDELRLRQGQLKLLAQHFGQLTAESLDLMAADLGESVRGPA